MRILLTSSSSSRMKYKQIFEERKYPMIDPSQKFFQMIADGIAENEKVDLTCLTELPISRKCHDKKRWIIETEIMNDHFRYIYLGFYNKRVLKQISLIISTYKYTKKWINENKDENSIIVCDPIYFSSSFGTWLAVLGRNIKRIGFVTDLPRMLKKPSKGKNRSKLRTAMQIIYNSFCELDLKSYSGYIFLTEHMKHKVSCDKKAFIVVEGAVDKKILFDKKIKNDANKVIMYAGGIAKQNGIDKLVKAIEKSEMDNIELHLYGTGPYVEEVIKCSKRDERIKYKGVLLYDEIVKKELEATILVNPRPSAEEFTLYSFPSKH